MLSREKYSKSTQMTAVIFQPMGNSRSWANGGCSRNNGSPFTLSPHPLTPSAFCTRTMPFALESLARRLRNLGIRLLRYHGKQNRQTRSCNSAFTRAGRHRVLKWAPFVFRIFIFIIFGGVDFRSYADTFEFFEFFEFFSRTV